MFSVQVVGFLVEYLSRVVEVKDTVHKQTLIYHVANIVLDQFPDATDLYSEIGSVTRCAKVDIDSRCPLVWRNLEISGNFTAVRELLTGIYQ